MKNKTLFIILTILTIIFIYLLLFPKKSYVEIKLSEEINPIIEETFNENIESFKIAANSYFEKTESTEVTLQELIEKNLIVNLKDSTKKECSTESKVIKDNKIILKCPDKEAEISLKETKDEKLICLYQYKKEINASYSDWSEWSEWDEIKRENDELTKVETKVEKIKNGTKTIEETKKTSAKPIEKVKIECPEGYTESSSKCIKKEFSNTITATISYTCKMGYTKKQNICYKDSKQEAAIKNYHCPNDTDTRTFKLVEDKCEIYNIKYKDPIKKQVDYVCPNGYYKENNNCYKNELQIKEVDNYKETTYYRYKTRTKQDAKYDIKWSTKDNQELLNNAYNLEEKVICEF